LRDGEDIKSIDVMPKKTFYNYVGTIIDGIHGARIGNLEQSASSFPCHTSAPDLRLTIFPKKGM